MLLRSTKFAILLVFADIALASIANGTKENIKNKLDVEAINRKLDKIVDTRRYNEQKRKHVRSSHRSTSSSSGSKATDSDGSGDSLDVSTSTSSGSGKGKKKYKPKSSAERTGWRKWHRKCPPCPDDVKMKWKDERIKWICGAYQRARRSFKSLCMMYFRNCQDGTMFTKIHDHRCAEDGPKENKPHGDHFFYDYNVHLSGRSSKSGSKSGSDGLLSSSLESEESF